MPLTSSPPSTPRGPHGLWAAVALAAMVLLAYLPAISAGYVWDDDDYVTANELLTRIDGLVDIWAKPRSLPQYYPLVHTTFWIEYRLWGDHPAGYHIVNLVLHAALSVLIWRILLRIGVSGAWIAAAIFAVHPVHVESVAWITERKNVLSGVCAAASVLCYLQWRSRAEEWSALGTTTKKHSGAEPSLWFWYAAALIWFAAALLSKTVTASLPAVLLLIAWWRTGRLSARDLWSTAPMLALGVPLGWLTSHLERAHVGAVGREFDIPLLERALIAGRALWFYLGKLIWPSSLTFNYPRWSVDASAWQDWIPLLAALSLPVALWFLRRRWGPGPLTAALYFGGTLLPALGFVNVYPMRYSYVADHFQYLASLGPIVLATAAVSRVSSRVSAQGAPGSAPRLRLMEGFVVGGILASLAALTFVQSTVYRNSETLWEDTARKNPSSWLAFNNLGALALGSPERLEEADRSLQQARRLNPNEPLVLLNVARLLQARGESEQAIAELTRVLRILEKTPDEAALRLDAHNLRGKLLMSQGRYDEAAADFERVVELIPDHPGARLQLGIAYFEAGRDEEAAREFRTVLQLRPDDEHAPRFLQSIERAQ